MGWQQFEGVESWTVDYERRELRLVATDGPLFRREWDFSNGPMDFARVTFFPRDLLLEMVTPWGETLRVEVYNEDHQFERLAGRKVVYLDQNKWVQVAQSLHRPQMLMESELTAVRKLVDLARAGEVILPLSSGHGLETALVSGQRRTRLAALMVGLSRGWIMRDPLLVRSDELRGLFKAVLSEAEPKVSKPVFTLDARHFHAEPSTPFEADLPPPMVELLDALLSTQAIMAVLLDDEREEREVELATKWAQLHEGFATHLATESWTRPHLRTWTFFRFLSDLGTEHICLAKDAGFSPERYGDWLLNRADKDVSRLPYLGRNREVIHLRLQDAGQRWNSNDLIDLMYLPCAAGYADYVVCEKQTAHYLSQVNRARDDGARVFASIESLVDDLQTRIPGSASVRR